MACRTWHAILVLRDLVLRCCERNGLRLAAGYECRDLAS
jgi:hypothetical protein